MKRMVRGIELRGGEANGKGEKGLGRGCDERKREEMSGKGEVRGNWNEETRKD